MSDIDIIKSIPYDIYGIITIIVLIVIGPLIKIIWQLITKKENKFSLKTINEINNEIKNLKINIDDSTKLINYSHQLLNEVPNLIANNASKINILLDELKTININLRLSTETILNNLNEILALQTTNKDDNIEQ